MLLTKGSWTLLATGVAAGLTTDLKLSCCLLGKLLNDLKYESHYSVSCSSDSDSDLGCCLTWLDCLRWSSRSFCLCCSSCRSPSCLAVRPACLWADSSMNLLGAGVAFTLLTFFTTALRPLMTLISPSLAVFGLGGCWTISLTASTSATTGGGSSRPAICGSNPLPASAP